MKKSIILLIVSIFLVSFLSISSNAEDATYDWGYFSFIIPEEYKVEFVEASQLQAFKDDTSMIMLVKINGSVTTNGWFLTRNSV